MAGPSRNLLADAILSMASASAWRVSLALLLVLACSVVPRSAPASDQYEYNAAGWLFRVTHHTGRITTYTFDDNGYVLSVTTSVIATGVEEEGSPPPAFSLGRAYPNPGSSTRFTFSLPHAGPVTVRLFDLSGRLVATVVEGDFGPGIHQVELSRGGRPAGVYYYRLDTPGFSQVEKFVLLE